MIITKRISIEKGRRGHKYPVTKELPPSIY